VLARLDQTLGPLDGQLGDAGVTLDIAVVRTGDNLGLRMRAFEISDFLRPLIHQENDQLHLSVVFRYRIGDVVEQGGFAGARGRDD